MFKKNGENSVISDNGYSMTFERELIIYKEGDHCIHIDRAADYSNNTIFIELNSIDQWLLPYENEIISVDRRNVIVNNLKEMIVFLGYKYQII